MCMLRFAEQHNTTADNRLDDRLLIDVCLFFVCVHVEYA